MKQAGKSRELQAESVSPQELLQQAVTMLNEEQLAGITFLDERLKAANSDSLRVLTLKELSSTWNQFGRYDLGGVYAQELAEQDQTVDAWQIAGTTYAICFQRTEAPIVKTFCVNRAITSFEAAKSLDVDNPIHSVNLALCYVDGTPEPMKGITMLREIAEKYPEHPLPEYTLARLAIRTGQFEKAEERLNRVVTLDSTYVRAYCLLQQVYEQKGDMEKAAQNAVFCEKGAESN
jgi:tetratricopeptide (TPR) repeat protein